MTSKAQFRRRLSVAVTRKSLRDRGIAFVTAFPGPTLAMAVIALLAAALRAPPILGLLLFPGFRLLWAYNRADAAARKQGTLPIRLDTSAIGPVALVSVSDAGLAIEGLNVTVSRRAIARVTRDAKGTTVVVRTRQALPNFTFVMDDPAEGRAFVSALGEASPRRKPSLPEGLRRGPLRTGEWVDVLRSGGATGYRSVPIQSDELWELLLEEDAPVEQRGAAAIMLAPMLDDDGRQRFQKVRRDMPHVLRVVMKAARGTDISAIEQALDACIEADR